MGIPLSCGPVLVWFPATRSIDVSFGRRNEGIYAVGAVLAPVRCWLWDAISPMILEPGLDLIGIESQEPAELHVRNRALLGPGIERRMLDQEAFRQCSDIQVLLHRSVYDLS
jgi:hypothetical protein